MFKVRELQHNDLDNLVQYWTQDNPEHFLRMGVDLKKIPKGPEFKNKLASQIDLAYSEKKTYCIIWLVNDQAVGHCNCNPIQFGESAFMHLHLWNNRNRKKGMGTALVKLSIPYFFEHLNLKELFCQPYALNPAPNKTLAKLGFHLVKKYTTIPGPLNFEQEVKLWRLGIF